MKKIRFLRTLCLAAGVFLLAAGVLFQLAAKGGTITEETLEFPITNNFKISCTAMDVYLHSCVGDTVKIEYVNDLPVSCDTSEEGLIRITQDASFSLSLFSARQFSYRMDVYLPEHSYRDFVVDTTAGNIFVDDIDMLSLDISTRSGSVEVVSADYPLSVVSQRGDVGINAAAVADDIYIRAGSGETRLTVPEFASFELTFETESGRITSDAFERKYENEQRDVTEKYGSGRHSVKIQTESGNLVFGVE